MHLMARGREISAATILFGFCIAMTTTNLKAAEMPEAAEKIPEAGAEFQELASFDRLMRDFVHENELPGATLAVSKDGRLVYARAFGWADATAEEKQPMKPDSRMRIASISKPVTAVAVLRLVEAGKLRLDDRVFDILKLEPHPADAEIDPRLKTVTIRQCLEHSGGWDRDKSFDPMFRSVEIARRFRSVPPAGPEQVIRYMLAKPLDFEPGTRYAYSNFGYCLLGRVIERVTDRGYEDHVREQVLKPLGITGMQIGRSLPDGRAEREVRYHMRSYGKSLSVFGEKLASVPWPYGGWNLEAMDSHGGWIASAVDLVRFADAFNRPEKSPLLSADSIAAMFSRPSEPLWRKVDGVPEDHFYGLGWNVRPGGDHGEINTWHTGSLDGTSTILVRRFDGLNWAVLFNSRETADGNKPAAKIDPLVHRAADEVTAWPDHDLYDQFLAP